jgi:FKBP-type peptidyl-prolyl cis-trans isomerase FkpA
MNRKVCKLAIVGILMGAWAMLFVGCGKDTANACKPQDVSVEEPEIKAFAAANGINATRTNRGLYYEIIRPGATGRPTINSIVYVTYKGTLLDGRVFDQQTNPGRTGFQLNGLIEGWKLGLPLIGKGGAIKLIVPSALGYGCKGSSDTSSIIKPNLPLYFEIELVDFFN